MSKVGELFIALGFDVDEAKMRNFSDGIIGIRNDMALLAGTAAAAIYGIDKFISAPIEDATRLENLSDLIGVAADVINKWEYAANEANPLFSKEAAGESIKNIQDVFAAIASGSSSAPTNSFLAMGLSATDAQKMNAIQFLQYVRSHFQQILEYENKLHAGKGLQFMQQDLQNLGVASGMWQMLKESQEDFNKSMSEADSQNSQLEKNKKLMQSINDLSREWDNFKMKMVGNNADQMVGVLKDFETHADNLRAAFVGISEAWDKIPTGFQTGLEKAGAVISAFIVGFLSPLLATILLIGAALDRYGEYEKNKDKESNDHLTQMHDLMDFFKGKSKKSLWDIVMQNDDGSPGVQSAAPGRQNATLDDFMAKHQVDIDRINAKAASFEKNPDVSMSNQSEVDKDIRRFEQTNHFNVQTEKFDESTMRVLIQELEDSAHNIIQSQVGNDPR